MVKWYRLDKVFATNTQYTAEEDRFYVVKAIGTDVSDNVTVKVRGVPAGTINSYVAPLAKTSSNEFGPLNLKDKFIVIPPDSKFEFESTGSGNVRLIGLIGVLGPGESLPGEHQARYAAQGSRYVTVLSDSYSVGTDTAWPNGVEFEVYSLTPATIETYVLNDRIGVKIDNLSSSLTAGQVGIKFYLDSVALDVLGSTMGPHGLDAYFMQIPPTDSVNEEGYTLADNPITVEGDHNLIVKAKNISGGALSPATDTSITITLYAVAEYIRRT